MDTGERQEMFPAKRGERDKIRKHFMRVFGVSFNSFYDGLTTVIFGKICIDICSFDDWLHRKHGNYEDRGMSMQDLLLEKYGEEGNKLIDELL